MSSAVIQPIAGVSANKEMEIEAVYPSVASGLLGSIIGGLMGGVAAILPITPFRQIGLLIVGSFLAPFALLAYAINKLFGSYYVVTNRSVQCRKIIGGAMTKQVNLAEIDEIEIETGISGKFHRVGDLNLLNAQGGLLMTIGAIPYPERLRQILFDARQARLLSDASFAQIESRG